MLNHLNPLSKHLLDGTLEETERLTEALPKLPLDEGTALRLRRRDAPCPGSLQPPACCLLSGVS